MSIALIIYESGETDIQYCEIAIGAYLNKYCQGNSIPNPLPDVKF